MNDDNVEPAPQQLVQDDSAKSERGPESTAPSQSENLFERFRTRVELCEAATSAASASPNGLRPSVFFYFVARYLVAVFEAGYKELPIQVWNEYRNALDHFMRHVTTSDSGNLFEGGEHRHLQRMETHLQRAALDVCKILCVKHHDTIVERMKFWTNDVLDLIDGGAFRKDLNKALMEAKDLFEVAKTNDAQLGHNSTTNRAVVERFIDAVYKHDEIVRSFDTKADALQNAKSQVERIKEVHQTLLEQAKEEIRPAAMNKAYRVAWITGIPLALFSAGVGWWLAAKFPSDPAPNHQKTQAAPVDPPAGSLVAPEKSAPPAEKSATNKTQKSSPHSEPSLPPPPK